MADLEPLIVGFTVAQPDDMGCTDLFDDQKSSINEYLSRLNLGITFEDFLPTEIEPNVYTKNSIMMHLELVGIAKVMGYPILKAERLLDQLREHGTTGSDYINLNLIDTLNGVMRRDLCINYFKKRGHYLKFRYYPNTLKCLEKGKLPSDKERNMYDEWGKVRFQKNFNFNYSPDLSEITKDSSCAPLSFDSLYALPMFFSLIFFAPSP